MRTQIKFRCLKGIRELLSSGEMYESEVKRMKKLGKKITSSQETIEAYCASCTACGSPCGCPTCTSDGSTPSTASSQVQAGHNSSTVASAGAV